MAKRRRFSQPPSSKEGHAFRDAMHHSQLVIEEVGTDCENALEDLLTAKGALEEGLATGGTTRLASSAKRSVDSAERRFAAGCICPRRRR